MNAWAWAWGVLVMEVSEKPSATRKGRIPEELQQQAKKAESPVINEFLVAARKGFTQHVVQLLTEGGSAKAATVDKVVSTYSVQLIINETGWPGATHV